METEHTLESGGRETEHTQELGGKETEHTLESAGRETDHTLESGGKDGWKDEGGTHSRVWREEHLGYSLG